MSFFGPFISTVAPRVLIPSFFIGQKIIEMPNWADIFQSIAFSTLFVFSVLTLFQGDNPWLSLIPGVAAWSYYKMTHNKENQEPYRYIDWIITTPLMLVALLVAAGASALAIGGLVALDITMIATGYLGIQETDQARRRAYFIAGMAAFLPILWALITMKKNKLAARLTLALWALYPIVWILNEEGVTSHDAANIAYSVMDVAAKVGLVYLLKF